MADIKAGDRVRLKSDHKATGTIDETWKEEENADGVSMASIVWDISGCVGEGPVADLEKIDD